MEREPGSSRSRGHSADPTEVLELIDRCLAGDGAAFVRLYRLHAGQIYRHLAVLLGPVAEVDDSVQMVFTTAFRRLKRFERRSRFSTWLHGIAVRVAANVRRSRHRQQRTAAAVAAELRGLPPGPINDPETRFSDREGLERLYRLLDTLSEKKRTVFLLHHVEHRDIREVAEVVGASENTTAARLKSARAELRRAVERERLAERRRLERER